MRRWAGRPLKSIKALLLLLRLMGTFKEDVDKHLGTLVTEHDDKLLAAEAEVYCKKCNYCSSLLLGRHLSLDMRPDNRALRDFLWATTDEP